MAVKKCRSELPKKRLAEPREIRTEIRRRKAQKTVHWTRNILEPTPQRPLRVQHEPCAYNKRSRTVASYVYTFLAESSPMIAIQLVGEIAKRGFVVHTAVVEIKDVLPLVQSTPDE